MLELLVEGFVFAQRYRQGRPQRNAVGTEEREFLFDAFDNAPKAVAPLIAARCGGDSATASPPRTAPP
jgi:hypothetical protein